MLNRRQFSTSPTVNRLFRHVTNRRVKQEVDVKVGDPIYRLSKPAAVVPLYPYGDALLYKQSNKGLYGGKMIQFGHKISEHKNRNVRTFKPNVNWQKLWSEALKRPIQIKVVGSVLKSITREGGIDNYLTKDKPARIKELGPAGWKLRFEVLSKLEAQKAARPVVIDHITVSEETGKKTPVFAKYVTSSGDQITVTTGRNSLLMKLYEIEGKSSFGSYTSFRAQRNGLSIEEILKKLDEAGFDFASITIQPAL